MVSVLFPHFDHSAIEERFASWQARTLFRTGGAEIHPYAPDDRACDVAAELEAEGAEVERVTWDGSDPFVFACRADMLDIVEAPMRRALDGRSVAVSRNDYVHRWSSMRGQVRQDLLDRIGRDAKSILEFGCGEAPLGAALKQRQKCRVVGIELDRHAAAIARKRIDDVYCGDAREIVGIMHETFDWIIGGDIVEHLDDPWTFLGDLRRITN